MTFHVGQKVVCVDDRPLIDRNSLPLPPSEIPTKGAVYTIRWAGVFDWAFGSIPSVRLVEIERHQSKQFGKIVPDLPYRASRFRPLIERKSSTSTGFEILDDIRKRETFDEKPRVPAR